MVDQHPADRRALAFDFLAHRLAQMGKIQSHYAKLHDRAVRLPGQQNLAGVVLAGQRSVQNTHVDRRMVELLDRHGHVVLMGQKLAVWGRHVGGRHFLEMSQVGRLGVEQRDERIENGRGVWLAHGTAGKKLAARWGMPCERSPATAARQSG